MSTLWLVVLSVLVLCSQPAWAQCRARCSVNIAKTLPCNIIDYNIYSPPTLNVTANEALVNGILAGTRAANVSAQCMAYVTRFSCARTYNSCDMISATAVKPCRQMCLNMQAVCGAYAASLPAKLQEYMNCDNGAFASDGEPCHDLASTSPKCDFTGSSYCMKWNATLFPKTGKYCDPFVSDYIYGLPIVQYTKPVDDAIWEAAFKLIDAYFPVLPLMCYKTLSSFICTNVYSRCASVYIPEALMNSTQPIRPCKELCELRYGYCENIFALLNITLPACLTQPNAPSGNYLVNNTDRTRNVTVNIPCQSEVFQNLSKASLYRPPDFQSCPLVLGRKENPSEEKNEPRCWLKCPDASYSEDEWNDLVILTQVGASLSLSTMVFLIFSYVCNYEKRKFPINVHIWEFVSCSFLAIAFLLNGADAPNTVWCVDDATFANQSNNSRCGAQGFLFIMFGLGVATWCCVIAYIMFVAIAFNKKVKDIRGKILYFHLFGWGVPLAFAIAALASNSVGYGAPLAWCFIQFEGFGFGSSDSGISTDYYVFYIPIGVLFVLIISMFWVTVAKIYKVRRLQVVKSGSTKRLRNSRTLQAQIRVLLFTLVVYIVCFTIFEWRFQIESENSKHHYDKVGFDWIACKIKNEVNMSQKFDIGNCPGDVPPSRINYRHTAAESFLISSVGFFMFFAFGSDPQIYTHWYKLFTLLFRGEIAALIAFVRSGKDPFGSATGTGTGTRTGTKTEDSSGSSKKGSGMDDTKDTGMSSEAPLPPPEGQGEVFLA